MAHAVSNQSPGGHRSGWCACLLLVVLLLFSCFYRGGMLEKSGCETCPFVFSISISSVGPVCFDFDINLCLVWFSTLHWFMLLLRRLSFIIFNFSLVFYLLRKFCFIFLAMLKWQWKLGGRNSRFSFLISWSVCWSWKWFWVYPCFYITLHFCLILIELRKMSSVYC